MRHVVLALRAAFSIGIFAAPIAAQLPQYVIRDSSVLFRSTRDTDRKWQLKRGRDGDLQLFGKRLDVSKLPARKRMVSSVAFNKDSSRVVIVFANDMPRRVEIDTAAVDVARGLFSALPNRDSIALATIRATYDENATSEQVRRWSAYGDALGTENMTGTGFRSTKWLLFGPLFSDSSYNRLVLDAPERVARVALSEIPATLRSGGLGLVANVQGIALYFKIRYYDASSMLKLDSFDDTIWYIPMDALRRFLDSEITLQALYRESFVLLNGNRIEIDYSARAR